jgi:predicted HTH domain antitoxin
MSQYELKIDYPEKLLDAVHVTRGDFEREARMAMAAKLFELGRLSSGMAAMLAKMDRAAFLLNLHHYGVPMMDPDEEELATDMRNA